MTWLSPWGSIQLNRIVPLPIASGPVSLPPHGGPWELVVVAVGGSDANRDRRARRRLQVCQVPLSGSSWVVNTWFRSDSRVFEWAKRVGFCWDLEVAMSLDQSPLSMSSRVGSSGWAMLQRHQNTIRYGCDGGCDNDGVYKGLVFTVIVTQSLSSFHCSTLAKRIYGLRDLCGFRGLFGFY